MKHFVYILQNDQGRFYIGQTDDLSARLTQHNDPGAESRKYAPKHGPWKLVWQESHENRSSAVRREREIKAMKSARWIREKLLQEIR